MKKSLIILVAIAFLAVNLGWSQETESADSIFKWFPQGTYMSMGHKNFQAIKSGKAFPLYEKYVGSNDGAIVLGGNNKKKKGSKSRAKGAATRVAMRIAEGGLHFGMQNKLPKQFEEGLISSTSARFSVFETITDLEELKDRQKSSKGKPGQRTMIMMAEAKSSDDGGEPAIQHTTIMLDNGAQMTVHRFANLSENVQAALKAGTLVKSGKKLKGKAIYNFATQEAGNRSNKLFGWVTSGDELLVCDNEKYLREMVKAGYGDSMRFLDDEDYVDIVQLLPDLGADWSLSASGKTTKQFEKEMDKSNLTSEEIESRKERMEKREILSINSWKVDEKLTKAKYQVYHTNEAAEEALAKGPASSDFADRLLGSVDNPVMQAYRNMLQERTKKEVSGNIFMSSVAYDETLFKAKERANEALSQAIMNKNGHIKISGKNGETIEFKMDISKEGKNKVTVKSKK